MSKTVLIQIIQFSISTHFISIWLIERTLSGTTTPSQSEPGSGGNEVVLCIPQSSSITGTSPLDCLVSYIRTLVGGGSYPSEEVQSVYSSALVDWIRLICIFIIKGFRTIVFVFIIISTTFRPRCPPAFFMCLSNSGTFTGVASSDSVIHNRVQVLSIPVLLLTCSKDWTCNLQIIVSLEA